MLSVMPDHRMVPGFLLAILVTFSSAAAIAKDPVAWSTIEQHAREAWVKDVREPIEKVERVGKGRLYNKVVNKVPIPRFEQEVHIYYKGKAGQLLKDSYFIHYEKVGDQWAYHGRGITIGGTTEVTKPTQEPAAPPPPSAEEVKVGTKERFERTWSPDPRNRYRIKEVQISEKAAAFKWINNYNTPEYTFHAVVVLESEKKVMFQRSWEESHSCQLDVVMMQAAGKWQTSRFECSGGSCTFDVACKAK